MVYISSVTSGEISSVAIDEISSATIDEISNAMNEISPMLPWFIYHQLRVVRYLQLPWMRYNLSYHG